MKKILSLAATLGAFALVVTPALASSCEHNCSNNHVKVPSLAVSNYNDSSMENSVRSWSNTGKNLIKGIVSVNGNSRHSHYSKPAIAEIETGSATALATVENTIGSNSNDITLHHGNVDLANMNTSVLLNTVSAKANTGKNVICNGGEIETGKADSQAGAFNLIGSNITRISM